ncbi:MutS-related protein [Dyadobacter sediminis]|uniref:DNA mismatch repair protein MutS n=1 Tax=Dyadobacter sediminis TaxID=1493691 RepID=A0A5R9KI43_9BACT|nr:DNA mismatch repair protein MutS [Dyadobacter sediminis]TLU95844.1 DNA mismatch repair protein MutS [Dyadobacter sediminis]
MQEIKFIGTMPPDFESRIQQYRVQIAEMDKKLKRVSLLRLAVFTGFMVIILMLANAGFTVLVSILLPVGILAFALVIRQYNRLVRTRGNLSDLKKINEQEIRIGQRNLKDMETGAEFLNPDHAYAPDLDIFGPYSLFQLLNRTTTEAGKIRLAEWLMQPAERGMVLERQKAVAELAPEIDWRQQFQAAGMPFANPKSSYVQLVKWIETPAKLLPQRTRYLTAALALGLTATLAIPAGIRHLLLFLLDNRPFPVMYLLLMFVSLIINKQVIKKLRPVTECTLHDLQYNVDLLAASESLISRIEMAGFRSELLIEWQSVFRTNGYSAVKEIGRLRQTMEIFQQRGSRQMIGKNDFYGIFNAIWLLDIYLVLVTEQWKAANGTNLKEWSTAIGNFESISSLAAYACANPDFVFPEIRESGYQISFENSGHPLLKAQQRVCNDFELMQKGSVVIVTGSNMAGKSTFLRTVGCNLVLAMAGAPCCAGSARISPVALFTSMRTQDNLQEGISSFYAELKRVEHLLQLIAGGQPVFFLLDEMFKGTNSEDRYKGGVSLIRQLSMLNASGIISTHDLNLAKVASQRLSIRHYSFNSTLKDEKIIFNYKLTEGFCTDFNASALMKKSGIDILPDV